MSISNICLQFLLLIVLFLPFIKIYGFNNPISSFTTHDVYVNQEIVFQHKIYNIIYKETTCKIYFQVEKSVSKKKTKPVNKYIN